MQNIDEIVIHPLDLKKDHYMYSINSLFLNLTHEEEITTINSLKSKSKDVYEVSTLLINKVVAEACVPLASGKYTFSEN